MLELQIDTQLKSKAAILRSVDAYRHENQELAGLNRREAALQRACQQAVRDFETLRADAYCNIPQAFSFYELERPISDAACCSDVLQNRFQKLLRQPLDSIPRYWAYAGNCRNVEQASWA